MLRLARKHGSPFYLGWKVDSDTPFYLGDYFDLSFPIFPIDNFEENNCNIDRIIGRTVINLNAQKTSVPTVINGGDNGSWLHFIFATEDLSEFNDAKRSIITQEIRNTFNVNFRLKDRVSEALVSIRTAIVSASKLNTIGIHIRRNTTADHSDWSKPSLDWLAKNATLAAQLFSCDCAVLVSTDADASSAVGACLRESGVAVVIPNKFCDSSDVGLVTIVDFLILCQMNALFRRVDSTFSALPQLLGGVTAVVYTAECALGVSEPYVMSGAAL